MQPVVMTAKARQQSQRGISLLEILIAASLLMLTSMSLAFAYGSTGLSSKNADRDLAVKISCETCLQLVDNEPYANLLTLNGTEFNRNGHTVTVQTNQVEVGLILVELVVDDDATGTVLSRIATYRADEV